MELWEIVTIIVAACAGIAAALWEMRERKHDHEDRSQLRLEFAVAAERLQAEIEKLNMRVDGIQSALGTDSGSGATDVWSL